MIKKTSVRRPQAVDSPLRPSCQAAQPLTQEAVSAQLKTEGYSQSAVLDMGFPLGPRAYFPNLIKGDRYATEHGLEHGDSRIPKVLLPV